MAGKHETGITDTGEQENPLNRKVRRAAYGWQNDPQVAIGDGQFRYNGVRNGRGGSLAGLGSQRSTNRPRRSR